MLCVLSVYSDVWQLYGNSTVILILFFMYFGVLLYFFLFFICLFAFLLFVYDVCLLFIISV